MKNLFHIKTVKHNCEISAKTNSICAEAFKEQRDYILPADIQKALERSDETTIRLETLEILAGITNFGVEDSEDLAKAAFEGKY